jgi:hypothetical protein
MLRQRPTRARPLRRVRWTLTRSPRRAICVSRTAWAIPISAWWSAPYAPQSRSYLVLLSSVRPGTRQKFPGGQSHWTQQDPLLENDCHGRGHRACMRCSSSNRTLSWSASVEASARARRLNCPKASHRMTLCRPTLRMARALCATELLPDLLLA